MRERYHADELQRVADNVRSRKWRTANPDRQKQLNAAWRAANPDYMQEYNSKYYVKNRAAEIARSLAYTKANPDVDRSIKQRRDARKRGAVCEHGPRCVTAAFLSAVYGAPCNYCGEPATEADHYRPLSRGGLHCRDNIVPACKPCNCSKHAKDPEVWAARRMTA